MSFIRPEDRSTRLRRIDEVEALSVKLNENEIAQIGAINNTSSYCRTLFFSYLALGTTLFILVSGTTHEDLLRETPVKMPLFDIGVPLLTFYVVAPLLFVLFHLNLLNKLWQLRSQIAGVERIDKELVRGRLFPFDYTLIDGGFEKSRWEQRVLWVIVGSTLYAMPVLVLLYTQYKFLPYHAEVYTLWHRMLIVACAGGLLIFNHTRVVRYRAELHPVAIYLFVIAIVLSWGYLVSPGVFWERPHVSAFWKQEAKVLGVYRNLQLEGRSFWALDPPPVNVAAYEERNGFSAHALLNARLRYGKPIDLRNRDLRYANFSGTSLAGANMYGANLQHANFDHAEILNADIREAILQRTSFRNARIQSANAVAAEFQGADLSQADLQGLYAPRANFQGTNLLGALLTAADLSEAHLEGANLMGTQIQGADLTSSKLDGADLRFASLRGTVFRHARLLGVDMRYSEIQGADFGGATIVHADLRFTDLDPPNRSEYWDDLKTSIAAVPSSTEQHTAALRVFEASERGAPPNFRDGEGRISASPSVLHTGLDLKSGIRNYGPPGFEDGLSFFLAELACTGPDIANGIIRFRGAPSPHRGDATFRRSGRLASPRQRRIADAVFAKVCFDGTPLTMLLSERAWNVGSRTLGHIGQ